MSNRSDGSTASYYELPRGCTELQHLISHRDMNAQIGEIFRACYRYGIASHSDRMRDARKIKFYIDAEIARLEAIEALDKEREIWIPAEPASEIDDESERQQLVQQSGKWPSMSIRLWMRLRIAGAIGGASATVMTARGHRVKLTKFRKCKVCRGSFEPRNSLHIVCSPKCGIAYAESQRKAKEAKLAKLDRQQHRERKEKLKTLADYKREAQAAVNAYVRLRDAHLGCVSCDKPATWQGQWHASHFRSVGSAPHLRFDLRNIHKACSVCNNWLSGNLLHYRPKLVDRIGLEAVEALEADQEPRHHNVEDLKAIAKEYRAKTRELKRKLDESTGLQ